MTEGSPDILRDAAIRLTMMPRDTNAHGTVFGGIILSYIDVAGGIEDVSAALDYLSDEYPGAEITLAGFSFGSRVGMQVGIRDVRVARLISIGTPVDKYRDYEFLTAARKPILFLHGDRDEFGSIENVRKLFANVSEQTDAELIVFENCGHFFDDHLADLRDAVREWVEKQINLHRTPK